MHSSQSDSNPHLTIDFGKPVEITSIRVYNRNDCCSSRIADATVSITADKDGRDVVWSSKFDGARPTYTFQAVFTGV